MPAKVVFLKPKSGLAVPNPLTRKPLAAGGENIALTQYWQRRLRDKDVTIAAPPAKPSSVAPSKLEASATGKPAPVAHPAPASTLETPVAAKAPVAPTHPEAAPSAIPVVAPHIGSHLEAPAPAPAAAKSITPAPTPAPSK